MKHSEPVNPFRDGSLAPREDIVTAEVVLDDAAALMVALQQSTNRNRLPPEEYLTGTRWLWHYSELPSLCPQCDHQFNLREHPRWIRKSTILLIVLVEVALFTISVFVPPLRRMPYVFMIAVPLLIFMPKAVYFRCPRCEWKKKFIVRSGRR